MRCWRWQADFYRSYDLQRSLPYRETTFFVAFFFLFGYDNNVS